jgi:hypothetical protein
MKRSAVLAMLLAGITLAACDRDDRATGDSSVAGTVPPPAARDSAVADTVRPDSTKPDTTKPDSVKRDSAARTP